MRCFGGFFLTGIILISCASIDPKKNYSMVFDADPVLAGTVEVEFDRFFSSKDSKIKADVVFYPRINAVALEFRHEFIKYRQFWDEKDRQAIINSVNIFVNDFVNQSLIKNYRKTRAIYGKTNGRLEWETFKVAKTHVSYPLIEIGYRFIGSRPYFSTLMHTARETNEFGDNIDYSMMDSRQINMYFTRTQSAHLAKILNQEYLIRLFDSH